MKDINQIVQDEFRPDNTQRLFEFILTPDEERKAVLEALISKNNQIRFRNREEGFSSGEWIDIPLTEEETEKAVQDANKRKVLRLEHLDVLKEKRIREVKELADLHDYWTASEFLRLMRRRSAENGVKLIEDDCRLPLIKALCFRLSNEPRYETELGYSFQKGLIIRGTPGIGKSYPIQLVADNPVNKIQIITMAEITSSVIESGEFKKINFNDHAIVYLDDVGTEYDGIDKIKHYGSEINWFKNYIEEYYAKYQKAFHRLMFTTNDSFDVLQQKYGFRVRDRFAQMFDVIDVYGESLRRK